MNNITKNNRKSINSNQSILGSNNNQFLSNHDIIEHFPDINAVSNQYIRNSVLKAYQTNNYFHPDDYNNNYKNTLYSNYKPKNHMFKSIKKKDGKSYLNIKSIN